MGLAKHKNNDSDENNDNDDDSININSKQTKQQLRIHVRQIPLGGFPSLPFDPALGERRAWLLRGRGRWRIITQRNSLRDRPFTCCAAFVSLLADTARRPKSSNQWRIPGSNSMGVSGTAGSLGNPLQVWQRT